MAETTGIKKRIGYDSTKYWRIVFPLLLLIIIVSIVLILIYYPATADMVVKQSIQRLQLPVKA
jgi:hypothetical protein